MKRVFTLLLALVFWSSAQAQETVIDFETFNIPTDTFLNGSDLSGGFDFDFYTFQNDYDTMFNSWTGWAMSTMTDTTTEGFSNQYSAITGRGFDGSDTYAVSYHFIPNELDNSQWLDIAFYPKGFYITNGTYPYLSMLNGDSFSKKFGGADGNDPDFFSVTIRGYNFHEEVTDSVEVMLADYTFDDNSQDYILDEWQWVDLESFGQTSRLTFTLNSSDVGMFGVNTPTYFMMDNFTYEGITSTINISDDITIYPNPANEMLHIDLGQESEIAIRGINGILWSTTKSIGSSTIDITHLPVGMYTISVKTAEGAGIKKFVKL